jgi:hypothetical protein
VLPPPSADVLALMILLLGDPTEKSGTTVGGFSMGIVGVESFFALGVGAVAGVGAVTGVGTVAGAAGLGVVTGVGTVAGFGAFAGVGAVAGVGAFAGGCAVADSEGESFAWGGAVAGGGGAGCGVAAGGNTVITGALSGNPFVSQPSTNSATNQSRGTYKQSGEMSREKKNSTG